MNKIFPISHFHYILFAIIICLFFILNILLPVWCCSCLRGDTLEEICIGNEWSLYCFCHPALPTWITRFLWEIFNHSEYAPYIASRMCVFIDLLGLWLLARIFLSSSKAFIAVFSMLGYWYFNGGGLMLNHSMSVIACWIWSVYLFCRVLQTEKNRYWITLGILLGISLNCKYSAIILILSLLSYMFVNPKARTYWKTSGPYLTISFAILFFLPHLCSALYRWEHILAFVTRQKTIPENSFILDMITGWLTQLAIISPILLTLFPLFIFPLKKEIGSQPQVRFPDRNLLYFIFFTTLLFHFILQCTTGVAFPNRHYGSHLWTLLPIVLLQGLQTVSCRWRWNLAFFWGTFFTMAEILSLLAMTYNAHNYSTRPSERFYPGKTMAQEFDNIWKETFPNQKCPYIATFNYRYGLMAISVYGQSQPRIGTHEGFYSSSKELNEKGGILIWRPDATYPGNRISEKIKNEYPNAVFKGCKDFKYDQKNPDVPSLKIAFALVPPAN